MVKDFVMLVGAMRAAQRQYFRTRSDESLARSKRLEREVDALRERILSATEGALPFAEGGGA